MPKKKKHHRRAGRKPARTRGKRKKIYTPEVLAAIPGWVTLGATRVEIAAALHTTVASLENRCSLEGISLRRPDEARGAVPNAALRRYLGAARWKALQQVAMQRDVTVTQLIATVVGSVVDNKLFPAVLDDYDDLEVPE